MAGAACGARVRSRRAVMPLKRHAVAVLLLVPQLACGQSFDVRQWNSDAGDFTTNVIDVLNDQYQQRECMNETGDYLGDLFGELRKLKGKMHSRSYLLLRDAILITAEDLAPFDQEITCQVIDRWRLIRTHLYSKIELIGNVLMITEPN